MTFVFQVSCSECLLFLKDFVTWQVCEMLSDISPGGVFYVAFCNYHFGAPCSLTDSQIHGLIKTGRFFENPLVGRRVLNRLKVDKHGSGFLFSLMVLKRKAPIELDAM